MHRHFPVMSPLVAVVGDDPIVDAVCTILQNTNAAQGEAGNLWL